MKISKKVEIAINAVALLKRTLQPVRSMDIAKEVNTTDNFMEQIMRQLRMAGIVTVKRGPGGGYNPVSKTFTAFEIAKAVGCEPQNVIQDMPADKLKLNIASAFLNTTV